MTTKRWLLVLLTGVLLYTAIAVPASAPGEAPSTRSTTVPVNTQAPAGKNPDQTGYIKGIYISHAALGHTGLVQHVQDLLDSTELNAVVLDFKSDRGQLTFPSRLDIVEEIGADHEVMIRNASDFMQWFTERGIYTIARIPVFKDNVLAQAHPEWAVIDANSGETWHDSEGMGWVDPNHQQVWDYNIALAVEAARLGFNEIQFDYIRFPSDGNIGVATFAGDNTQENRIAAIAGLLQQAKATLAPRGVRLAADVFGLMPWVDDDQGIGQSIEALAPYLDVLSPMIYPSTFDAGLPGESERYKDAIAYPYDIVYMSTRRTVERARAVNPMIDIRPWLQDFQDYAFDHRTYTPDEIRQQMDGAREAGGRGWLLWDPAVKYTRAALASAQPTYPANLAGKVLVIAYGDISTEKRPGARTPDQLRADLEQLLAGGYYPVNLRDIVQGKLSMVPAGKRPVVLTFDDSAPGQFRVNSDGSLDPDTAVGILTDFHAARPADWPRKATFFVSGSQPDLEVFGTPELATAKLKQLTDWGLEIGIQPAAPVELDKASSEEVQCAIGLSLAQLDKWLPGYAVFSLLLPEGRSPTDVTLLQKGTCDGKQYVIGAVALPGGGLTPSPFTSQFDPYRIMRVPAADLARWLKIVNEPGMCYVSPGEAPQGAP